MFAKWGSRIWPYLIVLGAIGLSFGLPYLITGSEGLRPPPPIEAEPPAPRSALPPGAAYAENGHVARITAILSDNPSRATRANGVSFLGLPLTPNDAASIFHIHVVCNVYALETNKIVVAIFRPEQERPVRLESRWVERGGQANLDFSFDMPAGGAGPTALDFRLGATESSPIVFNGPERENAPARGGPRAVVTVTQNE